MRVRTKRPGRLLVRVPPWVDRAAVAVEGIAGPPSFDNGYLVLDDRIAAAGATIALPRREEEIALTHRTRTIRARLRGDRVVAMENFGADLTFFDPL